MSCVFNLQLQGYNCVSIIRIGLGMFEICCKTKGVFFSEDDVI